MDSPNTFDNLTREGRYPVYQDLNTPWELAWKVQALYKVLKPAIDLLRTVEEGAQKNIIESVVFGENPLPVTDKAVTISNDLRYFVNTFTKYQNDEQVKALIDALKPKKVTDLEDAEDYATKVFVKDAIDALINGAPEALDTLKELADKLADNDDVVAAIVTSLNRKANSADVFTKQQATELFVSKASVIYSSLYIGSGSTVEDITSMFLHTDVVKGSRFTISLNNNYIFLLLPDNYSMTALTMNGMDIPMSVEASVTKEDITYNVYKSQSTYTTGNYTVTIL